MTRGAAGTGSPYWLICPVARRTRRWPETSYPSGHSIERTGRVRPRRGRGTVGVRNMTESHEYVCACGHVGWTTHVDVLRKPLRVER